MTVWCIFEHNSEGSYFCSAWSTQELAEAELLKRTNYEHPSVEEVIIDEEET